MPAEIHVLVGRDRFYGWKSLEISRTLGELCGSFSFAAVDFPADDIKKIDVGSPVVIKMVAETRQEWNLITGYVDRTERRVGDGREFVFSGRDRTSDLVDCSADYPKNTWIKKSLSTIASDLCAPFDIGVDSIDISLNDPEITKFSIKTGETVFDALDRLCNAYAILTITDAAGNVRLTRIGSARADTRLVVGENVASADFIRDFSGRYSSYSAKAQGNQAGSEWLSDKISLRGDATDTGVGRYRPLLFMTDRQETRESVQKRVNWEAQVRAGRAEGASVVVKNWMQNPSGFSSRPWEINETISIQDEGFDIEAQLVVSSLTFSINGNAGRETSMELSPPEIFAENPSERIELARKHSVQPS
jgi:prophage tail gpP-like protein